MAIAHTPRELLRGIVGSTAYGLATENSDIDRVGIFTWPTDAYFGIEPPKDCIVTTNPDVTMHEVAKYVKLALSCNPTVMELLWLPEDNYDIVSEWGNQLIHLRDAFPTRKRVRDAYLGYATQQFRLLANRSDGSFSADTRKRTAKHARHLLRLCHQGWELYATGNVRIDMSHYRENLFNFGDKVAAGDLDLARNTLEYWGKKFDNTTSLLPIEPDRDSVLDWLLTLRRNHLEYF